MRKKPEPRPEVAQIRKVYDIVLCVILVTMFILGPIYLFFAIYPQQLF